MLLGLGSEAPFLGQTPKALTLTRARTRTPTLLTLTLALSPGRPTLHLELDPGQPYVLAVYLPCISPVSHLYLPRPRTAVCARGERQAARTLPEPYHPSPITLTLTVAMCLPCISPGEHQAGRAARPLPHRDLVRFTRRDRGHTPGAAADTNPNPNLNPNPNHNPIPNPNRRASVYCAARGGVTARAGATWREGAGAPTRRWGWG